MEKNWRAILPYYDSGLSHRVAWWQPNFDFHNINCLKTKALNLNDYCVKIPRLYNRNAPSELNSTTYIITEEGMSYAHCKIWTCLNDFLTKISNAENFEVEEILVCLGFETGHICIYYFHLNKYFFNYEFEAFLSKISQCAELVHHCTAVTIAQWAFNPHKMSLWGRGSTWILSSFRYTFMH